MRMIALACLIVMASCNSVQHQEMEQQAARTKHPEPARSVPPSRQEVQNRPSQSQTQSGTVEGEAYRVGGNIEPPKLIRHVAPKFPDLPKSVRLLGYPTAQATTDADGNVIDVRLLRGFEFDPPQPAFDDAFVEAVRQWKYEPVYVNGKAHGVIFTVTVTF